MNRLNRKNKIKQSNIKLETKLTGLRKKAHNYAVDINGLASATAAIGSAFNPYLAAGMTAASAGYGLYKNNQAKKEAELAKAQQRKYMVRQNIWNTLNPDTLMPMALMPEYESEYGPTPSHNMSRGKNDQLINYELPPRPKSAGGFGSLVKNGLKLGAGLLATAAISKAVGGFDMDPKGFLKGAGNVIYNAASKGLKIGKSVASKGLEIGKSGFNTAKDMYSKNQPPPPAPVSSSLESIVASPVKIYNRVSKIPFTAAHNVLHELGIPGFNRVEYPQFSNVFTPKSQQKNSHDNRSWWQKYKDWEKNDQKTVFGRTWHS